MAAAIDGGSPLPRKMRCEKAPIGLRIAVVYNRSPFPMMRGDQLTIAHLLSYLKERGHSVDFYTLQVGGGMTREQDRWLSQTCQTVRIYRHGWWQKTTGLVAGLSRLLPLQVGLFINRAMRDDLDLATERGDYDVVYVYYLRSAPNVPKSLHAVGTTIKRGRPVVSFLAMQLSQTLNVERLFRSERNWLRRPAYWLEWKLLKRYEARVWKDFTRALLIGPSDVAAIKAVCRAEGQPEIDNWLYAPHGVDTDKYQLAPPEEVVPNRVVFSGSMGYRPNILAALWFIEKCWPTIRAQLGDSELVIQGRDPSADIRRHNGRNGITVTGTVPDVGPYIRSAAVCLDPVLAAGGMQNKLLEYMASGKAVVATSIANEGIVAPAGTLVVADAPEAFAEAVVALLKSPQQAMQLGKAAREYVVQNWTWEAHFHKLESDMYAALDLLRPHSDRGIVTQ
jgi:glycosyltransferase involved in cell wall biosynthesis